MPTQYPSLGGFKRTFETTSVILVDLLFFLFYRFLLIPPLIFLLKLLRPLLSGKLRQIVEERSTPEWPSFWAKPIWIHAASGEIEYAKPVIRSLRSQFPEIPILVTYFSPSAIKLLQGTPDIDFCLPLPFDSRKLMSHFIDRVQPLAVLFARTDVWPELAFQLKTRQIPTLLFSATLAEDSGRARGPGKYLSRFAFNQLSEISCVTNEDARIFSELGVRTELKIWGDSRFDQVIYRLEHPKPHNSEFLKDKNILLICGSTWPEDETVLLQSLAKVLEDNELAIVAPHEVSEHRIQAIETTLTKLNFAVCRYSQLSKSSHWQILILDQVGILAEVYQYGRIAFVGGSFKNKVHSVMEPLAAGLPVLVGPFYQNNREALHFRLRFLDRELTYVTAVSDIETLSLAISKFRDFLATREAKPEIKKTISQYAGSSGKIATWPALLEQIKSHQPE